MSAFVVEDETINKIVSYLYANANGQDCSILWSATKLYKLGFDLSVAENCIRLAQRMFEMNVAAVDSRYGEGEAKEFRTLDFKYSFTPASLIEVIKALESWDYQCTEGEIPFLRLYHAMDEVKCILSVFYVHQTEEYEGAQWQ